MFKLNLFILVVCLVACVTANEVKFTDCGNNKATKLELSNCSGDQCIIYRGSSVNFATDFISNQDTENVEIQISANVNKIIIPVPGVERDGCNHVKCPLVKGQPYHFSYDIIIARFMPSVKSVVTAQLVGNEGVLMCINFKVDVRD